ncbi:MAG: tyrosine--tRNA ligase [Candidatus Spechtbacteria bacterium SB0662_bin_43]|uniref:Tyrosine--tRNA ligase n=1 Tax=Candidatus Spechtbacteria bacterium SB0662_bin_43 TaxID=2604897 RepID=A0A845DA90_9BACT|nr:tyrosine--tRNA ligase [Candidatus Spechtbacteria bacterium SB0662_bin_43]
MDKKTKQLLTRGVVEIIQQKRVQEKIESGKALRVKFGIDPTGSDLHIGHTVNLWKLRQFQEIGHTAVIIIGDYTASIGDPSGKDTTRPQLSGEQIQENYKNYEKQALCILKKDHLEIRKQTEWFGGFTLKDIIRLMASRSVGEVLAHETFRKRLETDSPFSCHEVLYPFLQGYDSVAVQADIELGAIEQKFNLLMGRVVQKYYGQEPQDVMMSPYLIGTDGKEKMSKSLGNYIGLQDESNDMFGKVMSVPDTEIVPYFEMVTDMDSEELENLKQGEELSGTKARDMKMQLAQTIVSTFHGKSAAQRAEKTFLSVFQAGDTGKGARDVVVKKQEYVLVDLLVETALSPSKAESKRKVEEGAVYVDEVKKTNPYETVHISRSPCVIRIGKRRIVSVRLKD